MDSNALVSTASLCPSQSGPRPISVSPHLSLPANNLSFSSTRLPFLRRKRPKVCPCIDVLSASALEVHWKEQKLSWMIEEKVSEAKRICEEDAVSKECVVAWDEVEEVSRAKARLRMRQRLVENGLQSTCHEHDHSQGEEEKD